MAKLNKDVTLAVNLTGTGAGTLTPIDGVRNIQPPAESRGEENVTNYASAGAEKEPGLFDAGDCTVELQFDPSDPTHEAVRGLLVAGTLHTWVITIGTLKKITLVGFVKSFPPNLNERGQAYTATVTISVSGVPTWEDVAETP